MAVELPVPPSVNALWRVVRNSDHSSWRGRRRGNVRVIKAPHYRAWFEEAVALLRLHMPRVRLFPVAVRLTICPGKGWKPNRDLDNCLKAVLDAMVWAERLPDDGDEYVRRVSVEFGDARPTACCLVDVYQLGRPDGPVAA